MKRQRSIGYDLFLVLLLLKGTGLGIGADLSWYVVFLPIVLAFLYAAYEIVAKINSWDADLNIWALSKVNDMISKRRAKQNYRNIMANARKTVANEAGKGEN